jgi:predicted RecB family nuclease
VYLDGDRLVLSPSDLVGFLQCGHLTELSLEVAKGARSKPVEADQEASVVQRRGIEHERSYLARLRAEGLDVVEISESGGLEARAAQTREALAIGPDVVYQATFLDGDAAGPMWRGHADFLTKVEGSSSLGVFSYEPEDTKLATHVRPSAVLQLCEYAEQLAELQRRVPENIHVVIGDQTKVSLRLGDFAAYYRAAKERFVAACAAGVRSYPLPVEHCHVCLWRSRCDERRIEDDHLTLVPGLRTDQARMLATEAGITTVGRLAAYGGDGVAGIGRQLFEKLRAQARLQVEAREHPELPPPYELLEGGEPGIGLAALPEPSPGDLFFDIEGDPFVGESGLEYLLGVGWVEPGEEFGFKAFWAIDGAEEKESFEAFMDFVGGRQAAHPDLHIYHYAPYERTALGKLMSRYDTREKEVDDLFRKDTLVDLYRVVRQAVRVGAASYSLKKLEALYMGARTQAITDAGSSIDEYERWLETGDSQILAEIEEYNRIDCESTMLLRRWLEERRADYLAKFGEPPHRPVHPSVQEGAEPAEETSADELLGAMLRDGASSDTASNPADLAGRYLLANLLEWHRREDKPVWWDYFRRVYDCDETDLFEDSEAIAGLTYDGVSRTEKRSTVHRYRFDPDQEFKLAVGDTVVDPETVRQRPITEEKIPGPGTLVSIDSEEGIIELKRGTTSSALHPESLIPGGPINTERQREALCRVAASVIDHGIDGDGPYRATRDLLLRRPPRTAPDRASGVPLVSPGEDGADAVVRIGLGLDGGCLAVQGPPGSGKTRAAASLIVALVRNGKKVGITANSHAVITNLLSEVGRQADIAGVTFRASQKSDGGHTASHPSVEQRTTNEEMAGDLDGGVDIIAGTAWMFAREEFDQRLDHLIVDEAGQFSLANVMAVGTAAQNVVLLGDPLQLSQPSKGTHPDGAGASALGHVLGDAGTLPEDLGIFLEHTHRLHPEICAFISEVFYQGRLHSSAGLERQTIGGSGEFSGSGLQWRPVDHSGCRVDSTEEVEEVRACYEQILGRAFTDRDGAVRPIGPEDILVVAPYNAQVRRLKHALPGEAQVGTVDKFQGRQAPVVVCSMTASSIEEIPRGMEFLLSRNRLNVAVSRAQAMTIVVGSPKLLTINCRSVEQIRLVNAFCRYVEMAHTAGS